MWSAEVQAMLRPRRTFSALGREPSPATAWVFLRRPLKWFLVIGVFISMTTTGRLLVGHLFFTAIAWSFSPILQIGLLLLVLRAFDARTTAARAVDLFFVGQGPWLFGLSFVAATATLGDGAWTFLGVLLRSGILALGFFGTMAWAMVLSYYCFAHAFELGLRRGRWAMLLFYVPYAAILVGYFWVTGQLPPLLGVGSP